MRRREFPVDFSWRRWQGDADRERARRRAAGDARPPPPTEEELRVAALDRARNNAEATGDLQAMRDEDRAHVEETRRFDAERHRDMHEGRLRGPESLPYVTGELP